MLGPKVCKQDLLWAIWSPLGMRLRQTGPALGQIQFWPSLQAERSRINLLVCQNILPYHSKGARFQHFRPLALKTTLVLDLLGTSMLK